MDVRVTTSADHKGFAVPRGHEVCPWRPVARSSEVRETGDVVDFHFVDPPAGLAPSGKESGDQLLALGVDRGRPTVGDDRLPVSSQRDPAATKHEDVAEGLTGPAIAERLFLSRRTAETRISRVTAPAFPPGPPWRR